ncbi:MAG: TIGR01777 family oxidoreductase [Planctomycetales bacterium]|nr:TIGR01777 family oxidoreductase [Planctomycetales bacterium]
MKKYVASVSLPVGIESAFAYHEHPGALERLIPPWKNVVIESSDHSLKPGSVVVLKLKVGPTAVRWVAEHTQYEPPSLFVDVQRSGPFSQWVHHHQFEGTDHVGCVLRDSVSYRLPFGLLGNFFGASRVKKELETMFAYRHRVTRDDLKLSSVCGARPMTIAVSGSSGLVGKKLCAVLTMLGHTVIRLERSIDQVDNSSRSSNPALADAVAPWHSAAEAEKLSGIDAVVHLAGKPIADRRWTDSVKKEMAASRIDLTSQLAKSLAALHDPPKVFVCASAIGFYGDRGDEVLTEKSAVGDTFLAELADQWERSCRAADQAGIRVANARLGVVLDPGGGALKQMLTPAKLFGGALGNGNQWWSWVAIDDVIGAIYHAICNDGVVGPFNVTAPDALRNRDFAKTLGRVISRPALIPAPASALRLALGEMADALLLSSTHVVPAVLQRTGYEFRFAKADDALRYLLGIDRLESSE